MTLYQLAYVISKFIFSILTLRWPLKTYGKHNIPKGGAVICCNHVHNSDPFYVVYSFSVKDKIWSWRRRRSSTIPSPGVC